MKKIIHLSDLHIGFSDMLERFEHIIKMINSLKQPANNYIIVITGDLVERGSSKNYEDAFECIDTLKQFGYNVLCVPGNHDYCKFLFHWKKYVKKFKETYFKDPKIEYPKKDIIEYKNDDTNKKEKIAFLGLDSMAEELHFHDSLWANGEIGKKQLKKLDDLLKSEEIKKCSYTVVYLHHHPFDPIHDTHMLKDSSNLCKVLESHKIDALFFGHNHHGRKWNGMLNIPRCYDGGTSTRKQNAKCEHRVIDLSRDARFDYDGDFLRGFEILTSLG